ncbi:MAG: Tim44/TimA family putative adaptor protein [Terricaulis sp.]
MDNGIIIAVVGCFAAFILYKLYTVLGRRTGAEPPQPVTPQGVTPDARMAFASGGARGGGVGEGVMAILRADPSFDIDRFMAGARAGYEQIVNAFAKGDREALRRLLTPRVFEAYSAAITARDAKGEKGPELLRVKSAEAQSAELDGEIARIAVKFESELAEGAVGVRDAKEKWTFERSVRSSDPNWRLARVTAA